MTRGLVLDEDSDAEKTQLNEPLGMDFRANDRMTTAEPRRSERRAHLRVCGRRESGVERQCVHEPQASDTAALGCWVCTLSPGLLPRACSLPGGRRPTLARTVRFDVRADCSQRHNPFHCESSVVHSSGDLGCRYPAPVSSRCTPCSRSSSLCQCRVKSCCRSNDLGE
jgi:hypothetical protein